MYMYWHKLNAEQISWGEYWSDKLHYIAVTLSRKYWAGFDVLHSGLNSPFSSMSQWQSRQCGAWLKSDSLSWVPYVAIHIAEHDFTSSEFPLHFAFHSTHLALVHSSQCKACGSVIFTYLYMELGPESIHCQDSLHVFKSNHVDGSMAYALHVHIHVGSAFAMGLPTVPTHTVHVLYM